MTFELTDELLDSILCAIENQDQKFVVCAQSGALVTGYEADEDLFYDLPEWNSADGFALRQQFVEDLHSPMARNDLLEVLRSGKGVFRSFKDVLKSYPQVEKKWHYYKNKSITSYIKGWYNCLCETWGLQTLDYEVEETDDLVHDDFVFETYDCKKHRDTILHFYEEGAQLMFHDYPREVGDCVLQYWINQFEIAGNEKNMGVVCSSISNEPAGCIIFAPDTEHKTAVLTGFYVTEKYRGLGIAGHLLEHAFKELSAQKIKWAITADSNITQTILPLLKRFRFEQTGCMYIADVSAND